MKKKGKVDHTANMILRDPFLKPFASVLHDRYEKINAMERRLTGGSMSLTDFASGHEYFGLHRAGDQWVFREWAPYAAAIFLIGDFNGWRRNRNLPSAESVKMELGTRGPRRRLQPRPAL